MSDYISKSKLKEKLVYCRGLGRTSLEAVLKTIETMPVVDEKEIIRKPFERVVMRAEEEYDVMNWDRPWAITINRLKEIIKEECGISE